LKTSQRTIEDFTLKSNMCF